MWKSTIASLKKKKKLWFLFYSAELTDAKNIEWNVIFHYRNSTTDTLFYHDDLVLVVYFFITILATSMCDTVIFNVLGRPGAFKNI